MDGDELEDFFLNNQPDALIIQICSVIKLYTFRASSLPIIRSSLLYIRHWKVSWRFWWPFPSRVRMELFGSGHQNLHETYQCRIHSVKLQMMGKKMP